MTPRSWMIIVISACCLCSSGWAAIMATSCTITAKGFGDFDTFDSLCRTGISYSGVTIPSPITIDAAALGRIAMTTVKIRFASCNFSGGITIAGGTDPGGMMPIDVLISSNSSVTVPNVTITGILPRHSLIRISGIGVTLGGVSNTALSVRGTLYNSALAVINVSTMIGNPIVDMSTATFVSSKFFIDGASTTRLSAWSTSATTCTFFAAGTQFSASGSVITYASAVLNGSCTSTATGVTWTGNSLSTSNGTQTLVTYTGGITAGLKPSLVVNSYHGTRSSSFSQTVSQSTTISQSQSLSQSISQTISQSVAVSQSLSLSQSISQTISQSVTVSQSLSLSQSISQTVSQSASFSQLQSMSKSVSRTASQSISASQSASKTLSLITPCTLSSVTVAAPTFFTSKCRTGITYYNVWFANPVSIDAAGLGKLASSTVNIRFISCNFAQSLTITGSTDPAGMVPINLQIWSNASQTATIAGITITGVLPRHSLVYIYGNGTNINMGSSSSTAVSASGSWYNSALVVSNVGTMTGNPIIDVSTATFVSSKFIVAGTALTLNSVSTSTICTLVKGGTTWSSSSSSISIQGKAAGGNCGTFSSEQWNGGSDYSHYDLSGAMSVMTYNTSSSTTLPQPVTVSLSQFGSTRTASISLSTTTTQSASTTLSISTSLSGTESLTSSVSMSESLSASNSVSMSASDSGSLTISDSSTESDSMTLSRSLSHSVSNSASKSQTGSFSETTTQSRTATRSSSLTSTSSMSLSKSHSATLSSSQSQTFSVTGSLSESDSSTVSSTLSGSLTATRTTSLTFTDSSTSTVSRSSTWSKTSSGSLTDSVSRSQTLTRSSSMSVTLSVTTTDSGSVSASSTASTSSSPSGSISVSVTLSVSQSTSTSASRSFSQSMTSTPSLTLTRSSTQSRSDSSSSTASVSASHSSTNSGSVSISMSLSLSKSASRSSTKSATLSLTSSASASGTGSSSTTLTMTISNSRSSSLSSSQSHSGSESTTLSGTESLSVSSSASASASLTVSFTSTVSKSASGSASVSLSASSTTSATSTLSLSGTSSATLSASTSWTGSLSFSVTSTISTSGTYSGTYSHSGSVTSSASLSSDCPLSSITLMTELPQGCPPILACAATRCSCINSVSSTVYGTTSSYCNTSAAFFSSTNTSCVDIHVCTRAFYRCLTDVTPASTGAQASLSCANWSQSMASYVNQFVSVYKQSPTTTKFNTFELYRSCQAASCYRYEFEGVTASIRSPTSSGACRPDYDYVCALPPAADAFTPITQKTIIPFASTSANFTQVNLTVTIPGNFSTFFSSTAVSDSQRERACYQLCDALQSLLGIAFYSCFCVEGSLKVIYTTSVAMGDNATLTTVLQNVANVTSTGDYKVLENAYVSVAALGGPSTFTPPVITVSTAAVTPSGYPVLPTHACDMSCQAVIVVSVCGGATLLIWTYVAIASYLAMKAATKSDHEKGLTIATHSQPPTVSVRRRWQYQPDEPSGAGVDEEIASIPRQQWNPNVSSAYRHGSHSPPRIVPDCPRPPNHTPQPTTVTFGRPASRSANAIQGRKS